MVGEGASSAASTVMAKTSEATAITSMRIPERVTDMEALLEEISLKRV
jgi:hypothetical protein